MSLISDARADLFGRLAETFDVAPVNGYALAGRVFATQPQKILAPCIFIGATSGSMSSGGQRAARVYVVTFPVWLIYDGTIAAQVAGLDEVMGRLIAACSFGNALPSGHSPVEPPASITSTTTPRAAVLDVDMAISAHTFRPATLMEAASA